MKDKCGRKVYFIYDENILIYIGISLDIDSRIKSHLSSNSNVGRYISKIIQEGRNPIFFEYENKDCFNACTLESIFIYTLKPLKNIKFKHEAFGLSDSLINAHKFDPSQLIKYNHDQRRKIKGC